MMKKFIPDILDDINNDTNKLYDYKDDAALMLLFRHAFIDSDEYKFDLPPGDPPFEPDPNDIGCTHGLFKPEIRKLYVYTKKVNMEPFKREMHFIDLLGDIHISEAKILMAVKDQELPKLYPNITYDLVKDLL